MNILEFALEKYSNKKVSLGKAAEIANMPLSDFMKILSEKKIPLNYSIKSLEEDFNAAKR
ncbi:MAG TPA: UPF0175 family protein [Candidatus Nanoarchaeia archaeon]|nr:UPF0175 family protein [Candidatus Nanoarchaeia archaeon]